MKMNLVGFAAMLGVLLCVGCKSAQSGALLRMNDHYRKGRFGACLGDIQRARSYCEMTPVQKAETLLMESLCLEELGHRKSADTNYMRIIKEFPGTSYATRAEMRLRRLEPDQREHMEIDFGAEQWVLKSKQILGPSWIRTFRSQANSYEFVFTVSASAPSGESLEKFVGNTKAEMALRFPKQKWELIERDANNMYYVYFDESQHSAGVVRFVRTEGFFHSINYESKANKFTAEKKEQWWLLLRNAKIQPPPPVKTPRPPRRGSNLACAFSQKLKTRLLEGEGKNA